ncbi:MAG: hybrid sensor histidine kinase/response regulator [Burkholderiales bacterium]|nr:hybrid sensor histidine kinase/response regulator [Burkholderiales bacterium]
MIADKELAQLFKAESAEHLACLDDGLLRLEKNPADQSILEDVFREAHSMKGAARMLGLAGIETAAHGLESILNAARKGDAPLTQEAIEGMNAALLELRKLVDIEFAMDPIRDRQPEIDNRPIGNQQGPAIPYPPFDSFHIETVRVETRKLDDLLTLVGELSVIQGRAQHRLSLMDDLQDQWMMLERSLGNVRNTGLGNRIRQARDALYEDGMRFETTVGMLEEQVLAARLLPLSTVFALFPRMVRDLAREQGKEAELVAEGGEIGVDKYILEQMKDPLMHLLRNAIDHGIEPPDERERQGKPPAGKVRLRASRENGKVLLEVSDDGRGLDLEAIRRAASKRGLHDEAALAAMPPAQLQQLIFLPGFSTSAFVTELSGRGVGLDVVRVNVERLKGDIRMESVPHRGTAMRMRLPLSLATTRLLLASVGGRVYGLPVECIHVSRGLREEDVFTLEGHPAIDLEGQALIAPRLADLLALPSERREAACIVLQVGEDRLGLRVDEVLDEEEAVVKPLGAPLSRVRNVAGLTMLGSGEICVVLNPSDLLRSAMAAKAQPAAPTIGTSAPRILLVEDSALVRAMEKRILEEAGYEAVAVADGMDALDALGKQGFSAVVSDIVMPNMDGLSLTASIRRDPRYKDLPVILVTTLSSDRDKQHGLEAGANAYIPKPSFDQRVLLGTLKKLI